MQHWAFIHLDMGSGRRLQLLGLHMRVTWVQDYSSWWAETRSGWLLKGIPAISDGIRPGRTHSHLASGQPAAPSCLKVIPQNCLVLDLTLSSGLLPAVPQPLFRGEILAILPALLQLSL